MFENKENQDEVNLGAVGGGGGGWWREPPKLWREQGWREEQAGGESGVGWKIFGC